MQSDAQRAARTAPCHTPELCAGVPPEMQCLLAHHALILEQACFPELYLIRSSKDYDLSDRLISDFRTKPFS